jgi:hypothetical protein
VQEILNAAKAVFRTDRHGPFQSRLDVVRDARNELVDGGQGGLPQHSLDTVDRLDAG